ncbi:MAG: glutamine-hydrolyzing carbamoyl-phosphate synthase small subunit [bacterium]
MKTTRSYNWLAQREKKAFLALADGTLFRGYSVGAGRDMLGEVVFNTGLAGYQEILTDPSYSGQIVTMTYPEIGNYGVNSDDAESRGVFINGFIVHELNRPRNWRSTQSVTDYLIAANVPALAGIDTRALTTKLRDGGTQKAYISVCGDLSEAAAVARANAWEGLDGQDYVAKVTVEQPFVWDETGRLSSSWGTVDVLPETDLQVVAYDFGIKWNILRRLRQQGMKVTVVPARTPAADVLAMKPNGVFLSNGPADPAAVTYAVTAIRALIGKVPLMGICLGHQLLGLALGGVTRRLKFGHHGCNQPVMDLTTGRVEITSQNHNFCVDPDTLDLQQVEVTHLNLNDRTVEGLRHRHEPLFCVQYHPEASPGPHDSAYLFKRFRELLVTA